MNGKTGPEDIYEELVEKSSENWLYGLVAFAVIEEQRIEWMRHCQEHTGALPSADEILNWYQQQPENVILRAKGTAENALQVYSAEVVDIALEEERKEIESGIIVSEIHESKKFWPQFGVHFAGGLASAFVFAALLIFAAFLVLNDTSAAQIGSQLRSNVEETLNGQED